MWGWAGVPAVHTLLLWQMLAGRTEQQGCRRRPGSCGECCLANLPPIAAGPGVRATGGGCAGVVAGGCAAGMAAAGPLISSISSCRTSPRERSRKPPRAPLASMLSLGCLLLVCFHFPPSRAAAAGPWPSALRAGAKPQGRAVPAASPGAPGPPAREGLRGGFVPAPVLGTEGLRITQSSIRCCRPERGNGTLHYDVTMTGPRMSQTGPAGGVSSHGHSGPHSS